MKMQATEQKRVLLVIAKLSLTFSHLNVKFTQKSSCKFLFHMKEPLFHMVKGHPTYLNGKEQLLHG
jgi:hypothetical protein